MALLVAFMAVGVILTGFAQAARPATAQSATRTPNPTPEVGAGCPRTVRNMARLLARDYAKFNPIAQPGDAGYCAALEAEMNVFIEAEIASQQVQGVEGASRGAFAFIDLAARRYVGTMPAGTKFVAVARSGLPGSQMVFVQGDGFVLFVDYTFTTLNVDAVGALVSYQEYAGDVRARCEVAWCRAPGPQPTQSR
jgi:3-hydroxymyristoyl/3-hydroxydecanoyl-(acyl carrier protein) dehydratase